MDRARAASSPEARAASSPFGWRATRARLPTRDGSLAPPAHELRRLRVRRLRLPICGAAIVIIEAFGAPGGDETSSVRHCSNGATLHRSEPLASSAPEPDEGRLSERSRGVDEPLLALPSPDGRPRLPMLAEVVWHGMPRHRPCDETEGTPPAPPPSPAGEIAWEIAGVAGDGTSSATMPRGPPSSLPNRLLRCAAACSRATHRTKSLASGGGEDRRGHRRMASVGVGVVFVVVGVGGVVGVDLVGGLVVVGLVVVARPRVA